MKLRSVTYTSRAMPDVGEADVAEIHAAARTLNALDGVTGLLIYNGSSFLQIIEGAEDAIADLLDRLRADGRHRDFSIHDDRLTDVRSFPDWNMALASVPAEAAEARRLVARRLPESAPAPIRTLMLDAVETL